MLDQYAPTTAKELQPLDLSQQEPSRAFPGSSAPASIPSLAVQPQMPPQPQSPQQQQQKPPQLQHMPQQQAPPASYSPDDDELELPVVIMSSAPLTMPTAPQPLITAKPPTASRPPSTLAAQFTPIDPVSAASNRSPPLALATPNVGHAPYTANSALELSSCTPTSTNATKETGRCFMTSLALPSPNVPEPAAPGNTSRTDSDKNTDNTARTDSDKNTGNTANTMDSGADIQAYRLQTPQRQNPASPTRLEELKNSSLKSPSNEPYESEDFLIQTMSLLELVKTFPDSVFRRVVRERWRSSIAGSDYHMAFFVNILLKQAASEFIRPSFSKFGQKMVKVCIREIMRHVDSHDLDLVSEIVLEKASNELMDKIMAHRLTTIESRNLLNMLARAERLGYNSGDVMEDGVDANEESDLDFGVDVVTSDVGVVAAPLPPESNSDLAPTFASTVAPKANIVDTLPIPEIPSQSLEGSGSSVSSGVQNRVADSIFQRPPEKYLNGGGRPYQPHCPAGEPPAIDNDEYIVYYAQSAVDTVGFDPKHKCPTCLMIFPSARAKDAHSQKGLCTLPRHFSKVYGCRFCGTNLSSSYSLKQHATTHACGDYSNLGQTPENPNSPGHSSNFTPPLAVPKSAFTQKRRKVFEPPFEQDADTPPKRLKLPAQPVTPVSSHASVLPTIQFDLRPSKGTPHPKPTPKFYEASSIVTQLSQKVTAPKTTVRREAAVSSPTKPRVRPEIALEQPDSYIYAHLSTQEYNQLQSELLAGDERYNGRIDEALAAGDFSQVEKLKKSRATKRSIARKKFNVRVPRGHRYSAISRWIPATKGNETGDDASADAVAGVQTSAGVPQTLDRGSAKLEKCPTTTPKATTPQKTSRDVAQVQTCTRQNGLPGLLGNNSCGATEKDSTMPESATASGSGSLKPIDNLTRDAVQILSSDDSDTDDSRDSIPAKLPRPRLK